jgi:PAS domain S-box-containing protein
MEEDASRVLRGEVKLDPGAEDPVSRLLLSRDSILEAVGFASEKFLRASSWKAVLPEVLERLGAAADASRSYVFRNLSDVDGELLQDLTCEWCASGVSGTMQDPENHDWPYLPEYAHYVDQLAADRVMTLRRSDASPVDRRDMTYEGIRSTVLVPIFVGDLWWGYMGFDDCRVERGWSKAELDALKVATATLGAAVGREASEAARAEAERLFRVLVEQIPAVTYIDLTRNRAGRWLETTFISPQIEAITGYTPYEMKSDPSLWMTILHPEDRDAFFGAGGASRGRFEAEYRLIAKDGRTVWIHDEAVVVDGRDTAKQEWHGVMYDITVLKEALEREQVASTRLEQLDDMKNAFLNAVSHDLRTPVSAILGLSLTLERDTGALEENEKKEFAARIASNARKLNRIITDLLDMDRLSHGALVLEKERTELESLVVRVLDEADVSASHPVKMDTRPTVVSADPRKVERMVENLLLNAGKHTPPGTPIHVTVRPEGDGGLILVEDEGPGVPEVLWKSIFEPFIQGSESRALGGVGVGLSVVARFAEMHGGRAWVEEREGGGASFRILLP